MTEVVEAVGRIRKATSLAPRVGMILGSGLGGLAAAVRLAELGEDVVLVDADLCGWGASARNAGYITPTLGNDHRILKRFYGDRVRGLYRFANNSVTFTLRRRVVCDSCESA